MMLIWLKGNTQCFSKELIYLYSWTSTFLADDKWVLSKLQSL
jgi:hypothetical protein